MAEPGRGVVLPTTLVGSYPLPSWLGPVRATAESDNRASESIADARWTVVRELERVGLDVVTDGEVGRPDMLARFAAAIDGCERSEAGDRPLTITGPLEPTALGLCEEFESIASVAERPVKFTVTGPLTLASSSDVPSGERRGDVAIEFADLLADGLERATAAGADYVQFDEPALCAHEADLADRCLRRIGSRLPDRVRVGLHVCSSDPTAAFEMPVDEVSVPFAGTSGVTTEDLAAVAPSIDLAVGVVDSCTAAVESVPEIERRVWDLVDALGPERLVLTTDCGLRPLPRAVAFAKLQHMVEAVQTVRTEIE